MSEPATQAQDHDRRLGRLEGIAEQTAPRLDNIEHAIQELHKQENIMSLFDALLAALRCAWFSHFRPHLRSCTPPPPPRTNSV